MIGIVLDLLFVAEMTDFDLFVEVRGFGTAVEVFMVAWLPS